MKRVGVGVDGVQDKRVECRGVLGGCQDETLVAMCLRPLLGWFSRSLPINQRLRQIQPPPATRDGPSWPGVLAGVPPERRALSNGVRVRREVVGGCGWVV